MRAVPLRLRARGAAQELTDVAVYYGHRHLPTPDQDISGGLVKFQRMQTLYENSPDRFSVLYMVSSRQPRGAHYLARTSKARGAKLAWNQNGVAYPGWHGPGWERTNAPMSEILHAADHVFYQSDFCRLSADRYLGPRSGPWEVLYNAVDTSYFTTGPERPVGEHPVLLLGGSQYQYYRLERAVQALASVRRLGIGARLLVTGRLHWQADEDSNLEQAKRLAASEGVEDDVEFLGPFTQRQAPDVYRRADVLLHTKYNDPCPGVVVEAMACGLPVVYSDSGGVPELVGPDAGVGVPAELDWERDIPPDPDALAAGIVQVLANHAQRSQAARRRAVETFDIQPWLERHRTVFEGLVG